MDSPLVFTDHTQASAKEQVTNAAKKVFELFLGLKQCDNNKTEGTNGREKQLLKADKETRL